MKTSDLTGAALDWAVAEAEYVDDPPRKLWVLEDHKAGRQTWPYSTRWDWGGPLIEREGIDLLHFRQDDMSTAWEATSAGETFACGPTALIAAMRCYVTSRLGDEVAIPKEIL